MITPYCFEDIGGGITFATNRFTFIAMKTITAKRFGVCKSVPVREYVERELGHKGALEEEPSAYDLMKNGFSYLKSGIVDLATNPKHMEHIGR